MRWLISVGIFSLLSFPLHAWDKELYVAPECYYSRINFNGPSPVDGYMAGVAIGFSWEKSALFTQLGLKGAWNISSITGEPCQKSSVADYLLSWKFGSKALSFCGITPYTGVGYNLFENCLYPSAARINYRYNKVFLPIGFYALFRPFRCARVAVSLEWRTDLYADLHFSSERLSIKRRGALHLQIPAALQVGGSCSRLSLSAAPFFEWNQFGGVKEKNFVDASLKIPPLTIWNLGVRLFLSSYF